MYVAALSAMAILVLSVIAWAQDSPEQQGGSDPADSSAEHAQNPTPSSEQEATPAEQGAEKPNEQEAAPAQEDATVRILANAFDPPHLDVAQGSTVTFLNEDAVAHTVALEGLFDSYEIEPGATYPVWLGGGSGTVAYHDKTNPAMRGTITVGGASQGGAATPAAEPAGDKASQPGDKAPQANGMLPQAADLLQSFLKQAGLGGSA